MTVKNTIGSMTYAGKRFRLLEDFENHQAGEVFETNSEGEWHFDKWGKPRHIYCSILHAWLACGLIEEVLGEEWKPKPNEPYYYINTVGEVQVNGRYRPFRCERQMLDFGNVFKTEAEAEAALERVKRALKGNLKPYDFDELGKLANKARDVEAENDKKFGKEIK